MMYFLYGIKIRSQFLFFTIQSQILIIQITLLLFIQAKKKIMQLPYKLQQQNNTSIKLLKYENFESFKSVPTSNIYYFKLSC